MQRGSLHYYIIITHYYIIITPVSIIAHHYIFWSPKLADVPAYQPSFGNQSENANQRLSTCKASSFTFQNIILQPLLNIVKQTHAGTAYVAYEPYAPYFPERKDECKLVLGNLTSL